MSIDGCSRPHLPQLTAKNIRAYLEGEKVVSANVRHAIDLSMLDRAGLQRLLDDYDNLA